MNSRKPERGDEENSSFEFAEVALESTKPGITEGYKKDSITEEGHAHGTEDDHRFVPSEGKDIPRESLAERIRAATKGS